MSDANGGIIAEAEIVLQNAATNVTHNTETNGAGTYAFVNVPPGTYSLEVAKSGFASAKRTGITLLVNQAALLNVTLIVGSVQQTVTVSSSATPEQTTSATLGTVISTKSVNDLPLNGRNFTQMLELTPGVSRISVAQNAGGGQSGTPIGAFTFPSVNGQRNRANMFLLDGANDNGSYQGTYNYQPIVDAIEEFKVQSHSDLAEFGQATGGIVNVISKSGTNEFHGSAWEFIRNSTFDARNYFAKSVNPLRQNQFGVTLGGPIWIPHIYNGRNQTFFFFAYEGFRKSQASQTLLTTPTPAQTRGDFSNLLAKGVVIYNPFTTRPDPMNPGQYLRDPFTNNQIPTNLISPAALLYAQAFFPSPSFSGNPAGNAYNNQPLWQNSNSFSGRMDRNFGSHDFLYGRASVFNIPYISSSSAPTVVQTNLSSGYNLTVHDVHTFSPSSTLEAYFTRNMGTLSHVLLYPGLPSTFVQTMIATGFSSTFITGYSTPSGNIIPGIGVSGYLTVPNSPYESVSNADTYESGGAFSKIIGRHTLKAGGLYATNGYTNYVTNAIEGTSTFQTANLEHPTSPAGSPTGDGFASFLLGLPTSASKQNQLERGHGGFVTGVYLQDQIKLTQHLNLNIGARWDVTVWPVLGYLSDGQGYVGDMDLNNGERF